MRSKFSEHVWFTCGQSLEDFIFVKLICPKPFSFGWVRGKVCAKGPDSRREMMEWTDGHLFPVWPRGWCQSPRERGAIGTVPMQGCAGTLRTVGNMGWKHRRRSSDSDSMYIGPCPKQERNEAHPGNTGAEATPVTQTVWDAWWISLGSVTNL